MSALTVTTALGCAIAAGALFAFSAFVMSALLRLPAPQGIAAMQSINVRAVTTAFMAALFGPALGCAVLAVDALAGGGEPLVIAGAVLYLLGTIGVTIAGNVPLNDALARLDPDGAGAADAWRAYTRRWMALNHARVTAGVAAAALLAAV